MKYLFLLLVLFPLTILAQPAYHQPTAFFRIDSLPTQGILLDKGWKWHIGDNPDFAKADFDDSAWESIDPTKNIIDLPQIPLNGQIFWLRNTFSVGSLPSMIMQLEQIGATQIFLNGKQIHTFGNFDKNRIKAINPAFKPLSCPIVNSGQYVLSVRYVCEPNVRYSVGFANTCTLFKLHFFTPENWHKFYKWRQYDKDLNIVVSSFFICLCLLFFAFYLFFPDRKINLFFTIYTFLSGIPYFCFGFFYDISEVAPIYWLHNFNIIFGVIGYICIQTALHNQFEQKKGILFWFFAVLGLVSTVLSFFYYWGWQVYGVMVNFLGSFAIMLLGIRGRMAQKTGASIIAIGGGFYFLFWLGFLATVGRYEVSPFFYALAQISVPIAIAIFVGHDLAQTNIVLQRKLTENEGLFNEKQQILATQNETLEKQVAERTAELEHKNQELENEASLERIRSRAMAMRISDEINALIGYVFVECKKLGMPVTRCTIMTFDKITNDAVWWMANAESIAEPMNYHVKHHDLAPTLAYLQAWQNREQTWTYVLENEDKKTWNDYMFDKTELSKLPDGVKDSMRSYKKVFLNASFSSFGGITFTSFEPLSDQHFDLLIRVTNVFELTYTRFLDLQKAETQAREAQIEAALERVRSRSLAMRTSQELKDVITVVIKQFVELGFDLDLANFNYISSPKEWVMWLATPEYTYPEILRIPAFSHPLFDRPIQTVMQGQSFMSDVLTKEEYETIWRHFYGTSLLNEYDSAERKKYVSEGKGLARSIVFMKKIALTISNFKAVPYTNEQNAILRRFGQVFEQAYIRFLDLQKAEAQAREAQIEVALERVRSRSLAMHKSDEIQSVINQVSIQLKELQLEFDVESIVVFIPGTKDTEIWVATPAGDYYNTRIYILCFDNPIYTNVLVENRIKGVDYFTASYSKKEKDQYFGHLFQHTDFRSIADTRKEFVFNGECFSIAVAYEKFTALWVNSYSRKSFSESDKEVIMRFAKVFEQAYIRFLDLQKAEAQAREAVRIASLDRVRAEIASMRTTKDLERITPLIWTELRILDVPFFRCGVFIVNEQEQIIHAYLSTPEGKSLTMLHLPFEETEHSRRMVENWHNQQVYTDYWSHQQFQDWVQTMVKEGHIDSVEQYKTAEMPVDSFSLQFTPFKQGMLYVGNIISLSASQIDLVKSLADTFSVAYSRYEDFKQLEAAKARIEVTLTELKSTQNQLIQKEKLASLGELTAGIAHEIQNPLNFVNNFSELSVDLVKDLKGEIEKPLQDKEYIGELFDDLSQNQEKINHHGKRASSIVSGMLEHSRTSTGERVMTDINKLADEYLRLSYHGMRAKNSSHVMTQFNADYELIADGNLPLISVVPQDIGRVLLNLINNAFYAVHQRNNVVETGHALSLQHVLSLPATPKYQPMVIVSTQQINNQIIITIKDNGNGIPENIKSKIFQPFFTTKPTGEGTGLGLSLSYDIITKGHGGTIEVESVEGEGTTFVVKLPMNIS